MPLESPAEKTATKDHGLCLDVKVGNGELLCSSSLLFGSVEYPI